MRHANNPFDAIRDDGKLADFLLAYHAQVPALGRPAWRDEDKTPPSSRARLSAAAVRAGISDFSYHLEGAGLSLDTNSDLVAHHAMLAAVRRPAVVERLNAAGAEGSDHRAARYFRDFVPLYAAHARDLTTGGEVTDPREALALAFDRYTGKSDRMPETVAGTAAAAAVDTLEADISRNPGLYAVLARQTPEQRAHHFDRLARHAERIAQPERDYDARAAEMQGRGAFRDLPERANFDRWYDENRLPQPRHTVARLQEQDNDRRQANGDAPTGRLRPRSTDHEERLASHIATLAAELDHKIEPSRPAPVPEPEAPKAAPEAKDGKTFDDQVNAYFARIGLQMAAYLRAETQMPPNVRQEAGQHGALYAAMGVAHWAKTDPHGFASATPDRIADRCMDLAREAGTVGGDRERTRIFGTPHELDIESLRRGFEGLSLPREVSPLLSQLDRARQDAISNTINPPSRSATNAAAALPSRPTNEDYAKQVVAWMQGDLEHKPKPHGAGQQIIFMKIALAASGKESTLATLSGQGLDTFAKRMAEGADQKTWEHVQTFRERAETFGRHGFDFEREAYSSRSMMARMVTGRRSVEQRDATTATVVGPEAKEEVAKATRATLAYLTLKDSQKPNPTHPCAQAAVASLVRIANDDPARLAKINSPDQVDWMVARSANFATERAYKTGPEQFAAAKLGLEDARRKVVAAMPGTARKPAAPEARTALTGDNASDPLPRAVPPRTPALAARVANLDAARRSTPIPQPVRPAAPIRHAQAQHAPVLRHLPVQT